VFVRDDALGGGPSYSHIRLATASGNAGTWAGRRFATAIDVSGGQVHVLWQEAGTVIAERSPGGTRTKATVSGRHSRMVPIVVSLSGRATVVMASAERLYARTQVS
jgi:hypothetical protein